MQLLLTSIEHFVAGLRDVAAARGQYVEHYGTGKPYLPLQNVKARHDVAA